MRGALILASVLAILGAVAYGTKVGSEWAAGVAAEKEAEATPMDAAKIGRASCRERAQGQPVDCRGELNSVLRMQEKKVGVDLCDLIEMHCVSSHRWHC